MKVFYASAFLLFAAFCSMGQTVESATSGPWNQASTWVGGVVPNAGNSSSIIIRPGHIVNYDAPVAGNVDQLTVEGELVVDTGVVLTLANGDDDEVTVTASGVLRINGTLAFGTIPRRTVVVLGSLYLSGSMTGVATTKLAFNEGSNYYHAFADGGTIPSASWNVNSTVNIVGYASGNSTPPTGLDQNFGHFVWNCPNQDQTISLGGWPQTIHGDFRVEDTGGDALFYSLEGTGRTVNVGGDFVVDGGTLGWTMGDNGPSELFVAGDMVINDGYLQLAADQNLDIHVGGSFLMRGGLVDFSADVAITNLNLQGDYVHEAGELHVSAGTGNVNFVGASIKSFNSQLVPDGSINYSIATLSTVDIAGENFIGGNGNLRVFGSVLLGSTHPSGALQTGTGSGNIRVAGTRTYESGATFVYKGLGPQFIGNGFPSGSDVNLTIDNPSDVTLSTSLDIVALRTLQLEQGNIVIGSQTLTINGKVSGSGGVVGGSASNVVIGGTGDFGTLTFNGTNELATFTLNRTGGGKVTLGGDLTVLETFTHTAGELDLDSYTLAISGDYGPANPAAIAVSANSTLIFDGEGELPDNIAVEGGELGTLTLNRAGVTLSTASTVTIRQLNLLSGTFDNGQGVAIAASGTITRGATGEMLESPVNTTEAYNVVYNTNQPITSGPELPSNTTALNNLTKSGSGTLTLDSDITVNGILSLTSGGFNAGSHTVTLHGDFQSNGTSTLSGSTFVFAGESTITGATTPVFGNIIVSGTLNVSSSFRLNGNLVNDGILNASGGSTIFGGTTTISGSSVSSFGHVTIIGTLNAPAVLNVAGNWVNNGTFVRGNADQKVVFNGTTTISGSNPTTFSSIEIDGTLNAPALLTLAGAFVNDGTFNAGTGTVLLSGGGNQQVAGTATQTTFHNLTINKTSGNATLQTGVRIRNTLTLSAGVLNTNGNLTLLSTASGDARVAPITGTGSIVGNVTVQRYLPNADAQRAYRYLGSPVANAFVSDWKSEFPITGAFNDPSLQEEWPAIANLNSSSPSLFVYNESNVSGDINDRYEAYPGSGQSSTSASLESGRGYAAFVRQSAPIVIDVTGTLRQGNVNVNVTAQSSSADDGWNLIANPYASPIHWNNIELPAGVAAQIALEDNTGSMNLDPGTYVHFTKSGVGVPEDFNGVIASGQAFWVKATSNATITFRESDKEPLFNPDFIRQAPTNDILRVRVDGVGGRDEMVVMFSPDASDDTDLAFDAVKLRNSNVNLSSFAADGARMAINTMGSLGCNKEVGMALEGVSPGQYSFRFSELESFGSSVSVRLLDNFTGDVAELSAANEQYEFEVTDDESSFGDNRFKLYFSYPAPIADLRVTGDEVCIGANGLITIHNTQEGASYYAMFQGERVAEPVIANGSEVSLSVPGDKLGEGENSIIVMAGFAGCGAIPLNDAAVVRVEGLYEVTGDLNFKHCGAGSLSLEVSGAPEGGSYRWYESIDSPAPIAGAVGPLFPTPVLNKTSTYYVSTVNRFGCEGQRVPVVAEILYPDEVTLTINDDELVSSAAAGNHWYLNGEPIEGANGHTFRPTRTGFYEVEVITPSGCIARTGTEMIVLSAEEPLTGGYELYPNPASDILNIELPVQTPASGVLLNPFGQSAGDLQFHTENDRLVARVNMSDFAPGVYMIRIYQGGKIVNRKIVKK